MAKKKLIKEQKKRKAKLKELKNNAVETMKFDEAVAYVLEKKGEDYAYGYIPKKRNGKIVCGEIYYFSYDEGCEEEDEPESVTLNNIYSDGEDYTDFENAPSEAKNLKYYPVPKLDREPLGYRSDLALKVLAGYSETEAHEDYPCPKCDERLFKTGVRNPCSNCRV